MSSVGGIRLPGLATGMDTEAMVKEMLIGEQNKIDKIKQKEQTIAWQQEIYREVIKDIKGFQDNYFSISSPNSIISSAAWNTISVNSSNSNVITATGTAGAGSANYKFEVNKLSEAAQISVKGLKPEDKLSDLGLSSDKTFSIKYGDGENEVSSSITIQAKDTYKEIEVVKKDEDGNPIQKLDANGEPVVDADGKPIYETEMQTVVDKPADTIDSLIKKINNATGGEVKASYSEMTGEFTITSNKTGENSKLQIVDADGNPSDSLSFLGIDSTEKIGSNSEIIVKDSKGNEIKTINEASNSFTIDGIKYDVHTTGSADITSKKDVQQVVKNMEKFVEDYNEIMDKVYDLVTQKADKGYPPLTEAQKEDMSEEEIKKWEEKAKEGLLKNDSEMRRFMDHMKNSIFGEHSETLREFGLTTHEDYTKQGQITLDVDKFTKALETNGAKVYEVFAGGKNSIMESMKDTMYDYVGSSSSVFAKKAGLEKTASAVNNFYSEQLKKQQDMIKQLQRKMDDKENDLYKKFGNLEASMNKLNSQMNYFMQA